jgi:ribosomal protein L37E
MSSSESTYGECHGCGRAYPNYLRACRSCGFGLLKRQLRRRVNFEPSIPEKVLGTLDVSLFKHLNQKYLTPNQFDNLLAAIGKKYLTNVLPRGKSNLDTFSLLWGADKPAGLEIIDALLQAIQKAKVDVDVWGSILTSESARQFYVATTKSYDHRNLLADITNNLGDLDMLAGDTAELKLSSLKGLYFSDYRKFHYALTVIVKSVTLDDFPQQTFGDDNRAYPESGVVNSWYFYNKYGGRSGRGSGSRG